MKRFINNQWFSWEVMVSDTGRKVQNFYNKIPFPDYDLDRFHSKDDLLASAYPFAKILDRSILRMPPSSMLGQ